MAKTPVRMPAHPSTHTRKPGQFGDAGADGKKVGATIPTPKRKDGSY